MASEPTRDEMVEFLVAREGVSRQEAADFFEVLDRAEEEDEGSSSEMKGMVLASMREARLRDLVEKVAAIDPSQATAAHLRAIQRLCAKAVEG